MDLDELLEAARAFDEKEALGELRAAVRHAARVRPELSPVARQVQGALAIALAEFDSGLHGDGELHAIVRDVLAVATPRLVRSGEAAPTVTDARVHPVLTWSERELPARSPISWDAAQEQFRDTLRRGGVLTPA